MRLPLDSRLAYLTLAFCTVLYTFHLWTSAPPDVVKADAAPEAFSAERALDVLKDILQQEKPHPVGSAANQFVRARIEAKLNELGIPYQIQTEWACRYQSNRCAEVENIIATISGSPGAKSIVLMAHYDSVPTSTGAGDDGAAVAAILETARALISEAPLNKPVVLLFTDGEESGLLGAEAFFQNPVLTSNIGVVLNYEGSGTSGVSRVLRTSPRGSALIDLYQQVAAPAIGNSLSNEIFKRMPNDTDFSSVMRANLTGIDFAFAEERNHYHTHNDSIENLDLRTLQHHGNNMLPVVRALLQLGQLDAMNNASPLVYTDPYGLWLQWPASWQPVLVLIAAILLALSIWRYRLSAASVARSGAIVLFVLLGALLGGAGLFKLIETVIGPLPGWPAQPVGFRIVLFAAPLCAGLAALWLCRRWAVPLTLYTASLIWLLAISIALTLFMPDAANIFILGLVPATAVLLVSSLISTNSTQGQMYFNLLALAAILPGTLGLAQPIEASQGYGLVIAILPGIALFILFLTPFLLSAVRMLCLTALVATVAGFVLATSLPLYSEYRPQPINFSLYQNQDTGQGYLTVRHRGLLPNALEEILSREPREIAPFHRRPVSNWIALNGQIDGGSGIKITQSNDEHVTLSLYPRKNVASVRLYFPKSAGLQHFEINGQRFPSKPASGDYDSIELTGLFGKQVDLKLAFTVTPGEQSYLANTFYPLPDLLDPFVASRQPLGAPVHQGDQAVSFRSIDLSQPFSKPGD